MTTGARYKLISMLTAVASVMAASLPAYADGAPPVGTPTGATTAPTPAVSASGTAQTANLPGTPGNQSAAVGAGAEAPFKPGPTIGYFGWYFGPSVTAPGSPLQPTTSGFDDPGNQSGLLNYLSFGYKLTKELTLSATAWVFTTPFKSGDYAWNDPYLKLTDSNIYTYGGFSIKGDVRIYVPATQLSQNAGILAGFRTTPKFDYTPPGSRWTFELTGYLWATMYGQYATPGPSGATPQNLLGYLAPNVAYQFTPTFAGTLLYELYGHHDVEGIPPLLNTSDPTDVELGVSWDATPWLNFGPYLQAYPGSFSWSSTSFGMMFSAQIL